MIKYIVYKLDRIYNGAYTFLHGYFWLPCPICGKNFGGHEIGGSLSNWGGGMGVCKFCGEKAEKRNKILLDSGYFDNY